MNPAGQPGTTCGAPLIWLVYIRGIYSNFGGKRSPGIAYVQTDVILFPAPFQFGTIFPMLLSLLLILLPLAKSHVAPFFLQLYVLTLHFLYTHSICNYRVHSCIAIMYPLHFCINCYGKTHEFRASGSPLSNNLMQICADSNPSLTKQSAMHSYTFS